MAYDALQGSSGTGGGASATGGHGGSPDELALLARAFDQAAGTAAHGAAPSGDGAGQAATPSSGFLPAPVPYSATAAAWQAALTSAAGRNLPAPVPYSATAAAWQAALTSAAGRNGAPVGIAGPAAAPSGPQGSGAPGQAAGGIVGNGPASGAVTRSTDASGLLLSTTTTAADGSQVELVNDTSGGKPWSSVQSSYDAAGALVGQHVQYRDHHVDDLVIDPASQKVSSSTSTQADGTRLDTTYDLGGSKPWSSTTLHEDAAGHVTEADVQNRDGSATRTGYDAKGVADSVTTTKANGSSTVLETNTASQPYGGKAWTTTQGSYDAAGHLTDEVAHNLDGSTTTSHYDVANKDALQFQTTRNADGSSMDMVEDSSGGHTYSAYDVYKDASGHITSQNIFDTNGSLQTTLYTASGAVQNSTTTNADHTSSVVTENADGSFTTADYTAAGQLADEAVAHADKSVTKTVYQSVNGTAVASVRYQFNADGSWVEDDLDDALAGSPLLVQQVHAADGTETDYVHAPQGGQSYSSYTVQKDKAGTVTEEDIQGTDGSYTQDLYAGGKLAKSTRDAKDGSYAITYLSTGTQPWAAQTYDYTAQGQYSSAQTYYAATAGKAAYWTQDTWTGSSETWTGQSTHYDNGTEYDVVIGAASDSFSFYTVGKDAAGVVRQQTVVNADGSTVVLGSDRAGHVDSRTILPAGGGWDQEVVNAAGQTSAIVSHGADGSQIVQAFTTGGAPGAAQTLSYQSLYDAAGVETQALLVGADGSRTQESYGADGRVASASVTRADGTVVSAASYGAGGAQTSATTLNSDGSHTVLGFDAAGRVQRVSFTHDDGSGASFVVEAGGLITPGQAVLNQVSVALAEQILAQPADGKHTVSQKVTLPDGELYNVTMGAAGNIVAKHEHPNGLLGDIEEGVGILADVLSFIPGADVVAIPLAVGLGLAEGGQAFSQGDVVGGLLDVAGAVAGADGAPDVSRVVAVAQGVKGVIVGAQSGDIGVAIASGLGGLGAAVGAFDPELRQLLLTGSALAGVGVAASGGDVLAALGPAITAVAGGISAADQMTSDPDEDDPFAGPGTADAGAAPSGATQPGEDPGAAGGTGGADLAAPDPALAGGVGAGAVPGGDAGAADPFAGPGVDGAGAAAALAAASVSIPKAAEDAAANTAAQAGGGQVGTGSNGALDVSRQSGGLPTTGGVTDTSGMVHVDIDPVSTSYGPAGGASVTSAGLPMVAAGVAGGALAAGGSGGGSGLGGSAAVGGAAAESGGVGAFVSGALDVGLDVLGSAVAAPVMFFATLLAPTQLHDDTLNALKPQSGGTSSGAAPGGSSTGDNPATPDTAGTSANTGNLAPMTGTNGGSGVSTTTPGFSSAPALPQLPGFTPTSDAAKATLDAPETLPADTTAGGATVVSTPAASSIPPTVSEPAAGDGLQGPNVLTMAAPTPGDSPMNQGQQDKHIVGTNNYQPGRSILTASNPQALLDQFGGTGVPVNDVPSGQPGFRERVDFGQIIGNFVDQTTGTSTPTTNGIIHYGNSGAHIVPAAPNE